MRPQLPTLIYLLCATLLFGCKTDGQMEEALVGTWQPKRCPFYQGEDNADVFWFYGNVTFRQDRSLVEEIPWAFCKDTCETPPSDPMEHCTCTYYVENGDLIIVPNAENPRGHGTYTNHPYLTRIPIKSVTANKLVIEESEENGVSIECTCLERI